MLIQRNILVNHTTTANITIIKMVSLTKRELRATLFLFLMQVENLEECWQMVFSNENEGAETPTCLGDSSASYLNESLSELFE